jgi:hypothetical protein
MDFKDWTRTIEPVEDFLSKIVCADRLALYQRTIDVIKANRKFSIIDSINSVILLNVDESGSEIVEELHILLLGHLRDILLEYDLVVVATDLAFLCTLLETLNVLDTYEAHDEIINTIDTSDFKPVYKLYTVLNIINYLDEEQYSQTVKMCSLSLLERIRNIHVDILTRVEDSYIEPEETDFTLLKKVVGENTDLIINRLITDSKITKRTPVEVLTQLARVEFEDLHIEGKTLCRELIGVYLASGLTGPALLDVIRSEITNLVSEDAIIARANVMLGNVYVEMST